MNTCQSSKLYGGFCTAWATDEAIWWCITRIVKVRGRVFFQQYDTQMKAK